MSWLDKTKNGIIITTADGGKYRPQYMNASFVTEYNFTEFNFVDVGGSLVKRKKPIGKKYALELHFQGPNHLDIVKSFVSSIDNNEGPIQIDHPLYDLITVQITSLGYDDSALNRTKVTGTVIETIEEAFFTLNLKELDQIPILFENTLEVSEASLTLEVLPGDINTMNQNNAIAYSKGVPIIQQAVDFEEYFNAFNTASTYINTATATPLLAMRSLINVITLPQKFEVQVQQRIKVLLDTFTEFRNNLFNIIRKENHNGTTYFFKDSSNNDDGTAALTSSEIIPNNRFRRNSFRVIRLISRTGVEFLKGRTFFFCCSLKL